MGNPKEAFVASADGVAPPPYSETDNIARSANAYQPSGPAPSYGTGESSSGAGSISGVKLKFPPALNAYVQWKLTMTFHIGERKETPLYAVRTHSGFTKNPELVLYDGPSDKHPILATANHESIWKPKRSVLTIPAREGVSHDTASQRVEMNLNWSLKHQTYTFEADVGAGKDTRRERFEWRGSHGGEVRELDGYKWGWKLVRLSSQLPGGGGERATRVLGSASDGNEVVAAWAHNNSMSMTKAFKFQFMGSALTGMMGDRWATLALISALRMWWIEIQQRSAVAAS
ncbi:hypothetical protein HD806DRAFT_505253 [Xylariaceae sp. AK1471]|nr:hypothetical protein HD806DRAFT_505253 [Xylariaceae sp. AK1471]